MKYLLLVFVTLAMGFNTMCAADHFMCGKFFAFGVHCAFIVWWILQLVDLQFGGWV